ncbi:MAG TPA: glycosyltransferase family 39 protein [Terriglobia bacterium]|nr:glycosyltransferase family 39 protein [Terriglobia bacterium]
MNAAQQSAGNAVSRSALWFPLYAAVAIFAAEFCWIAGHRGLFLIDQSILFDGAWRVVQGQAQYRDFFSAFPPVAFLIQAFFFRLFGVTFSATVIAAAFLNFVATISVMYLVLRMLPRQKACAVAAGLLTAVWFQAPFGMLWFEQTAFAFNLVALTLIVQASGKDRASASAVRIVAGVLLGASVLSKQNAGIEFLPFALGLTVISDIRRPGRALRMAGHVLTGMLLTGGALVVWLWKDSSLTVFWRDYFMMATQIASDRSPSVLQLAQLLLVRIIAPRHMLALLALGLVQFSRKSPTETPNYLLTRGIAISLIVYQALFILHSYNEEENAVPYLGIIYGLALALLLERSGPWIDARIKVADRSAARVVVGLLATLVFGLVFIDGLANSWYRTVQKFDAQTRFTEFVNAPGLSRVLWGNPTKAAPPNIRPVFLDRRDFENLNEFLTASNANFFVFKDATMLYGLHHRISPQPWLYFSPGHGFRNDELPRVDAAVVESLQHNNVEIIIVEKETWVDFGLLDRMPQLLAFIARDFEKVREFGIYEAYRRKTLQAGSVHDLP